MDTFNPTLNIAAIQRKQKGLVKLFGGLAVPFYYTAVTVVEGQPMALDPNTQDLMAPTTAGNASAAAGLALQVVYDDSTWGELRNYHFANSTKARLGNPIGLLTGQGYALTNLYTGTVAWGQQAFWDSVNNVMTTTQGTLAAGDKLPVVFEGSAVSGPWQSDTMGTISTNKMVRIRYQFDFFH